MSDQLLKVQVAVSYFHQKCQCELLNPCSRCYMLNKIKEEWPAQFADAEQTYLNYLDRLDLLKTNEKIMAAWEVYHDVK